MSELNDKELFESAISDTPLEATPEPAQETPAPAEADTDGQPRDDKGRFAPKAAEADEPAPQAEAALQPAAQQQQTDTAAQVPSWRLREVNEEREAAVRRAIDAEARAQSVERQIAELRRQSEPKPEPIDVYADPLGAFKQQLSPIEQQLQTTNANTNLKMSRLEAMIVHGAEAVTEAEKAVGEAMKAGHPGMAALAAEMRNSEHPVGVALNWHQREKLLKETGGDLSSYKNKTLEDALNDPAFLAKAMERARAQASGQAQPNGKPNTTVQLPPSLNRAPSAASPHEEIGTLADRDLYAFATR